MNEHLTTLKEMRDEITEYLQTPGPDDEEFRKERDALDAAIRSMELLEQSSCIEFGNDYICRLGDNPPEYGLYAKGEAGFGDYSSYYEAFTALKEKK